MHAMDNKTYLMRATAIALLMLGSIATGVVTAQRAPSASSDSAQDVVAQHDPN